MLYWLGIALIALFFLYKYPAIREREKRAREYNKKYAVYYFMFDEDKDADIFEYLQKMSGLSAYLLRLVNLEMGIYDNPTLVERHRLFDFKLNSADEVKCVKVELERDIFDREITEIESWEPKTRNDRMKELIKSDMEYRKSLGAA